MASDPVLEKYEGKKFVFCLPGDYYSGTFLTNIVGLNSLLAVHGIKVTLAQTHSSCIHRLRNICGGGDVTKGTYQTPFGGLDTDYDYLLWIDSDIVFNRNNFIDLLEMDVDIATGWYYQPDGNPACGFVDKNPCKRIKSHPSLPLYDPGHTYLFRPDKDIADKTDLYVVDWVGMGWMLIKKGVMEKTPYPWFAPKNIRATDTIVDTLSEDLSFQLSLRDAGFEIIMNPRVRVGHEKVQVI